MSYHPPGQYDPYGQPDPYGQQQPYPQQYPPQPHPQQPYPPQYHGHYRHQPMSGPPMMPGYPMAVVVPTSGTAVASLIFGLIGFFGGFCLFGIPCAIAVLLGHVALRETRNGHRAGHGMAVAGLILGYIFLIPAVIVIAMGGFGAVLESVSPGVTTSP
ncbi:MAG TPA: DUF4190 domain-containing protein [Actinoplanes sp.]|nr:DUF4190 domain-containing protein [Actinoplanes sp.]